MRREDELFRLMDILWSLVLLAVLHHLGITRLHRPFHAELIIHNAVNNYLIPAKTIIENLPIGGADNG